mgnify:CR=1 FL=1
MTKKQSTKPVEYRDEREEMNLDDDVGPLYIDESLKEDGYFYRIVSSSKIGSIQRHMRMGYEIVHQEGAQIGSSTVNNTSQLSSAVTVELGQTKSDLGVLMRIPLDKYERRQAAKRKKNQEAEASVGKTGIPTQFGEVTVGTQVYKK